MNVILFFFLKQMNYKPLITFLNETNKYACSDD